MPLRCHVVLCCPAGPCCRVSICPLSGSSNAACPCCIRREQAQISPLEAPHGAAGHADGSWRERNHCKNQGDVLAAWQQQPACDSRSVLSQKKSELNLVFLKKMVDLDSGEREGPFICRFYFKSRESVSSEMQTQRI